MPPRIGDSATLKSRRVMDLSLDIHHHVCFGMLSEHSDVWSMVAILGWQDDLEWHWKPISIKFESKHSGRLRPGPLDQTEFRILNRLMTWSREGILYEADKRYVEICLRDMGLKAETREDSYRYV